MAYTESGSSFILSIKSWRPQGSVLGHILFLFAVNDLPDNGKTTLFWYLRCMHAGNTTFFLSISKNINQLQPIVNCTVLLNALRLMVSSPLLNDVKTKHLFSV